MRVPGLQEEQGSSPEFLQRGYRVFSVSVNFMHVCILFAMLEVFTYSYVPTLHLYNVLVVLHVHHKYSFKFQLYTCDHKTEVPCAFRFVLFRQSYLFSNKTMVEHALSILLYISFEFYVMLFLLLINH